MVLFIVTFIGTQTKVVFLSFFLIDKTLLRTGTLEGKIYYFVENGFELSFDGMGEIIEISKTTFSHFEIYSVE